MFQFVVVHQTYISYIPVISSAICGSHCSKLPFPLSTTAQLKETTKHFHTYMQGCHRYPASEHWNPRNLQHYGGEPRYPAHHWLVWYSWIFISSSLLPSIMIGDRGLNWVSRRTYLLFESALIFKEQNRWRFLQIHVMESWVVTVGRKHGHSDYFAVKTRFR